MEDCPAADAGGSGRRTRTLGAEASSRRAVLHRLRALRRREFRASDVVQVKVDGPIYDTVAEEEYNVLVARRRKEAGEFIIDDGGLGYDEDWSHRALTAQAKRQPPQAQQQSAKAAAASLSAAAAKTGQQISSMFTSSVFKRPVNDRPKSLASSPSSLPTRTTVRRGGGGLAG